MDRQGLFAYATGFSPANIYGFFRSGATGYLAAIPGSPFSVASGLGPKSASIDPSGKYLYVAGDCFGAAVFSINRENGSPTLKFGSLIPLSGPTQTMKILSLD
jgi:hypothetical protein